MYIKNRIFSLCFKVIIIVFCVVGVYGNSGMSSGIFKPNTFLYYTILSNIFCLIYFLGAAIHCINLIRRDGIYGESTFSIHLKGSVMMAITVTLLIYWFVLVDAEFIMTKEASSLHNLLVHFFVPIFTILDWLLFDRKGQLKIIDPLKWLLIPLIYYVCMILVSKTGITFHNDSRYPYFFIDIDVLGYKQVIINVFSLTVFFTILGFAVVGIDKLLMKTSVK